MPRARNCSRCKIIEADSGAAPGAPLVPSVSHRLPRRAGASDPRARPRTPGDVAAAGGEPRATPARVRAEGVVGRGAAPEPDRGEPPSAPSTASSAPASLAEDWRASAKAHQHVEAMRGLVADVRARDPAAADAYAKRVVRRRRAARAAPAPDFSPRSDPPPPPPRATIRRRTTTPPRPRPTPPPPIPRATSLRSATRGGDHGGRRPGVLLSKWLLILQTDDGRSQSLGSRRRGVRLDDGDRARVKAQQDLQEGLTDELVALVGGVRAIHADRDGAVVGAEPARARSRGDWSGAQRRVSALGGWEAGGGV